MPVNSQKRPSDSVALIPQAKKTKNDVVVYTQKDKQLKEIVKFGIL